MKGMLRAEAVTASDSAGGGFTTLHLPGVTCVRYHGSSAISGRAERAARLAIGSALERPAEIVRDRLSEVIAIR